MGWGLSSARNALRHTVRTFGACDMRSVRQPRNPHLRAAVRLWVRGRFGSNRRSPDRSRHHGERFDGVGNHQAARCPGYRNGAVPTIVSPDVTATPPIYLAPDHERQQRGQSNRDAGGQHQRCPLRRSG